MGRIMFCYPNRADDATLSGGSYETALPLTNGQGLELYEVARATDDAVASTQFAADLGASTYPIRLLALMAHNISLAGKVRVRGYDTLAVTRADTATFIDEDGLVQSAASGVLRQWHYVTGNDSVRRRLTLLEALRENICLQSEVLGTTWVVSTLTVGDNAGTAPDGETTAESLTATAGNATLIQDLGVIGSTAFTFTIWFKRITGTGDIDLTLDNGATWTTKTITTSWARYEITQTLANPDCGVRLVTNADVIHAWGGDVAAAAFSASYNPAVASAETRAADSISLAFPAARVAMTGLVSFIERGTSLLSSSERVIHIGSSTASADPRLTIYVSGGNYRLEHDDGSTVVTSTLATAPSLDDFVELRWVLFSDGAVQLHQTLNSGAEVSAAKSAATTLTGNWAGSLLWLNSAGTGNVGFGAYESVKVETGEQTLETMRAEDDPNHFLYSAYDSELLDAYPAFYPAGEKLWGKDVGGLALQQEQYDDGETYAFIHVIAAGQPLQLWSFEVQDTANVDNYVEFGGIFIASAYEATINMRTGGAVGHETDSTRTVGDGGPAFHDEKNQRRLINCVLPKAAEDEAMVQQFALSGILGTSKRFFVVWNSEDTHHMQRRAFPATMRSLSPIQFPHANVTDMPIAIVEEL